MVDRLADGDLDEELDVVDDHVGVDLEAAADQLPGEDRDAAAGAGVRRHDRRGTG